MGGYHKLLLRNLKNTKIDTRVLISTLVSMKDKDNLLIKGEESLKLITILAGLVSESAEAQESNSFPNIDQNLKYPN